MDTIRKTPDATCAFNLDMEKLACESSMHTMHGKMMLYLHQKFVCRRIVLNIANTSNGSKIESKSASLEQEEGGGGKLKSSKQPNSGDAMELSTEKINALSQKLRLKTLDEKMMTMMIITKRKKQFMHQ